MATITTMIVSPTFGRFVFDAVFHTDHQSNVTVTQHPVQVGAPVSDHAYQEPDEVTLEIGMSDAMVGVGNNHSVNAYNTLRAIQSKREPIKLITRLWTYSNMILTSISAPDDQTTMFGMKATICFQSIAIVDVAVVKVQQTVSASKSSGSGSSGGSSNKNSTPSKSSSAKTSSTTKTTKSSTEAKTSVLKQIANLINGN